MRKYRSSEFSERFVLLNDLKGRAFKNWAFLPGMRFMDMKTWWGRQSDRSSPHEGLDLAVFIDAENTEQQLSAAMKVPPLFKGRVIDIIDDLLGRTIIVGHPVHNSQGLTLNAFYAHLVPDASVTKGKEVGPGESLGTIAPGNSNCPAHLHLSTAWCSAETRLKNFSWQAQSLQPLVKFFDPEELLGNASAF